MLADEALFTGAEGELALPGGCPTWIGANADGDGDYRSTTVGTIGAPPAAAQRSTEMTHIQSRLPRAARLTQRERLRAIGEVSAATSAATSTSATCSPPASRWSAIAIPASPAAYRPSRRRHGDFCVGGFPEDCDLVPPRKKKRRR